MSKDIAVLAGADRSAVRSTINLIQAPVYLIDVDSSGSFRFFAVNESEERVLGLEQEEIEGRRLEDVLDTGFAARRLTALRQCAETRSTVEFENFVDRPDGPHWGRDVLVPLFDAEERLIRIVGTARDVTDQKRAVQDLQQTIDELRKQIASHSDDEQRFERVFQEGPMGMVVVDLETRVLEINRAFCRLLGYTPAELIGKKSSYFTHPDDLGINAEVVHELLGGRIPVFYGEKRCLRKDGRVVWARVTGTVIRDGEGNPAYGLGMAEDITGQRSAEETIRKTNRELQIQAASQHEHIQRFERVFEMGPIGMCIVGPDLKLSKVNKAMCEISGYAGEELTGLKFEEITHPDDVEIDVELAGRLFRGEIPFYQIEKRYIRKDGSIRWGHLTATMVWDETGTPLYGLGMVKDIQERKVAEEAVARATRLFEEAEQIAGLGSWELVLDTGKVHCSDNACRIFGLNPGQQFYSRDDMSNTVHPDDRDIPLKGDERLLATGEPIQVEYRILPGGELRHIQVRARLEMRGGHPERIVGIARDITETRRLERQFLEAQRMEAIGGLASGVAHDFNNILTVITGYASLMRAQMREDPSLLVSLQAQSKAVDRAAALARQLLAFSRKQRFEPRVLDL